MYQIIDLLPRTFRASASDNTLKDGKDGKNKNGKSNSLVNSGGISEGQEIPVRRLAIVKVYKVFSHNFYTTQYAAASAETPGASNR